MEDKINELPGVTAATITYTTKQLRLSAADPDKYLPEVQKICASIESEVKVVPRDMVEREKKQKLAEGHSHEKESNDKKSGPAPLTEPPFLWEHLSHGVIP